ncbi:hypothetical protein [Brachybacterium hainanense]|uniref:Amino acid transporter n=1 Tax=Brachybacterium hainanense TaxID=1541174 RepID=A0ABV6R622_9MICO
MSTADHIPPSSHVETAGAFDIRRFIAALTGLYGLILTALGLFAFDAAESAKTDGLNANLWAGIALIVFSALFFAWAKLDPIRMIVSDNEPGAEDERDIAAVD